MARTPKEFLSAHKAALAVLLLLGALHLGVLLTSQGHVDGDEAVVGMMGRHILLRHARPLFFYGQVYGTGAALEAYLAAAFFAVFGSSAIALKLVSLLLFWGALILAYVLSYRFLTGRWALWTMGLLGLATPLIEWRTKMRGGYAGIPFFSLLIVLLYLQIIENERKPWWRYLLLGLAMGGAWFNSSLAMSLLAAIFFHALFVNRRFFRPAALLIPVGILLALLPLVAHELQTDYEHTRYLLSLGRSALAWQDIRAVFGELLPRFFVPGNVDQYLALLPWWGWLEYGLYGGMTLIALFLFFTMRSNAPAQRLLGLMLLAVGIHLVLFAISADRARSPRYLLPLYTPLLFIVVIVSQYLCEKLSQTRWRYVSVLVLGLLVSAGFYHNVQYLRPPTVTDDILLTDWRVVNIQTDGRLAGRLIAYLQSQDITYVRTGYFLQWRMMFESQEAIIASSEGYFPTVPRFAEYDAQVAAADRVAFVFHQDSMYLQWVAQEGQVEGMRRAMLEDYVIFTP